MADTQLTRYRIIDEPTPDGRLQLADFAHYHAPILVTTFPQEMRPQFEPVCDEMNRLNDLLNSYKALADNAGEARDA